MRKDYILLQQVLARLREHGCVPVVETGHGSHMKVRWTLPSGASHMLIVPKYNGDWRQERNTIAQLNRKLKGRFG